MRVGLLGAFSVDNPGDVFLGRAARAALLRSGVAVELFAPRLSHPSWGHDWSGARGVGAPITPVPPGGSLEWTRGLDALIIGGGGFLLPHPEHDVFLGAGAHCPTAWNGVCALNGDLTNPAWMAKLRAGCAALAHVSVRNAASRDVLLRSGFGGEVAVIPDVALGLDLPAVDVGDVLARAGVDGRRRLVGLSVGRSVREPFFARLAGALAGLDADIVIFPFGNVYGDAEHARVAAAALPRAKWIREPLAPLALAGVIARMSLYVATRFHAMLAAFLQDVPFLVLDEYRPGADRTSKIYELIKELGLEHRYLCPRLGGEPAAALDRPAPDLAPARAALRARLDAHHRLMLARLGVKP